MIYHIACDVIAARMDDLAPTQEQLYDTGRYGVVACCRPRLPALRGRGCDAARRLRRRHLAPGRVPRVRFCLSRPRAGLRGAVFGNGLGENDGRRGRAPRGGAADVAPSEQMVAGADAAAAAQRSCRTWSRAMRSRAMSSIWLRPGNAAERAGRPLHALRDRNFAGGGGNGVDAVLPRAADGRSTRLRSTGSRPSRTASSPPPRCALIWSTSCSRALRAGRIAAHARAGRRRHHQGAELRLAQPTRDWA